jgi:hypothetical protein
MALTVLPFVWSWPVFVVVGTVSAVTYLAWGIWTLGHRAWLRGE